MSSAICNILIKSQSRNDFENKYLEWRKSFPKDANIIAEATVFTWSETAGQPDEIGCFGVPKAFLDDCGFEYRLL